jgi:hypothetical protein
MAIRCALDWRHGLVTATLTRDPEGSVRLALGHGPDELVVHVSLDSLDALVLAGLTVPRPAGRPPWDLTWLTCC